MPNWLLPEGVSDILPAESRKIEGLRRLLIDQFTQYGYELVSPPMLEYIESLLAGAGRDADLRTFKLVDQMSGRMMGVRADMTPQVARIDAHLLNRRGVTRLCYVGSVLHVRPFGLHATREPLQIGAEIYGHAGLEADAEIQGLALSSLELAGFSSARLDLSHAAVLHAIFDLDPAIRRDETELYSLLRAKDVPGLQSLTAAYQPVTRGALLALPALHGSIDTLARARAALPPLPAILNALEELENLARLAGRADVTIDLGDLRGYEYESGAMFALYVPGLPNAVARGGRYDHVGEAFGRARPATGFSMDLRELARLLPDIEPQSAVRAPWTNDPALQQIIVALRNAGEIVVQDFPGQEHHDEGLVCDRLLAFEGGEWVLKSL